MSDVESFKRQAAARALAHVRPGMKLGLGTGSTARHFVDLLGEKVAAGLDVLCVPTSRATATQASALGVALTTLDETPELDLTVDGADELDAELQLVKGGGGALLREKIVAAASKRMIVIADAAKLVARLGAYPLPVEVVPFGFGATLAHVGRALAKMGFAAKPVLRHKDGHVFVTDGGHWIVDCPLGAIADPAAVEAALREIPGVVDCGLFLKLATGAILCGPGGIKCLGDVA